MTSRSCFKLGLAIVLCLGFALMSSAQDKPVTDICLGCICEAISGCNQTALCQGGVCGLFRITWPYWSDGGKLTVGNDSPSSENDKPLSDVCLGCICEAVSGCNRTANCNGGACGPFHITKPYWTDGGKLTIGNDSPSSESAYPNCANDIHCAANTIQNYMTKFGQDCNGDNVVDCNDYAAIHALGGYGCKGELSSEYSSVVSNCLSAFSSID